MTIVPITRSVLPRSGYQLMYNNVPQSDRSVVTIVPITRSVLPRSGYQLMYNNVPQSDRSV